MSGANRDFERTRRELIAAEEACTGAYPYQERLAAEREAMIKEREAAEAEAPAHKQQRQGPYEEWQAGGFQGGPQLILDARSGRIQSRCRG